MNVQFNQFTSLLKQTLVSKRPWVLFITAVFFLFLFFAVFGTSGLKRNLLPIRKKAYTRLCANLAPGLPQQKLSPEQESRFKETTKDLPKCGEALKITDALTGNVVTSTSSTIKIEAVGFSTINCDRAEITLRLVKGGGVVWEKKEIDSSCSVSKEGKPGGSYILNLATPSANLDLSEAELEICFDLVNKSGQRASQNPVSSCEILAFIPYLCQKIPVPDGWR